MALKANFLVRSNVDLSNVLDLVSGAAALRKDWTVALTDGAGLNKAENFFSDTRSIAASTTDSLDLSGALTNVYGVSLTFTKIKAIILKAATTNGSTLQMTAPVTNGLAALFAAKGDALMIKPGGIVAVIAPDAAGYAVTATSADLLDIINDDSSSPGTASYDIIIIGETT